MEYKASSYERMNNFWVSPFRFCSQNQSSLSLPPTNLHNQKMFRQASRLLARAITLTRSRAFSSEVPATPTADSAFIDSWKKIIPNMEPPNTPSSFMVTRPQTPTSIPSKLTVNFVLPYASELSAKEVCFAFYFWIECFCVIVRLSFLFRVFWAFAIWVWLGSDGGVVNDFGWLESLLCVFALGLGWIDGKYY